MSTWYAYEQIVSEVQREQRHAATTARHAQQHSTRWSVRVRQLAQQLRAVRADRQAQTTMNAEHGNQQGHAAKAAGTDAITMLIATQWNNLIIAPGNGQEGVRP